MDLVLDRPFIRHLEVVVLFQHLQSPLTHEEVLFQAYQRLLHNQRRRGQGWYGRRRHLPSFREERNARALVNKRRALEADESRIRDQQHRHFKTWYETMRADPVRYQVYRQKQNARARRRRER